MRLTLPRQQLLAALATVQAFTDSEHALLSTDDRTTLAVGNRDGGASYTLSPTELTDEEEVVVDLHRWKAWLADSVVRALPVTRFRITDREPFKGTHPTWGWSVGDDQLWALPKFLFDQLPDVGRSQRNAPTWKDYTTREAALDALSVAAGRVVRRSVYGQVPA